MGHTPSTARVVPTDGTDSASARVPRSARGTATRRVRLQLGRSAHNVAQEGLPPTLGVARGHGVVAEQLAGLTPPAASGKVEQVRHPGIPGEPDIRTVE